MKKELYDGPLDRTMEFTDIGPEHKVASGKAVQDYIKDIDSKKVGAGYTDENNITRMFCDDEAMNAYKADPSVGGVLVEMRGEPLYAMSIYNLEPESTAVPIGSTGNYISFDFETRNKSGQIVREAVVATYTITRGSSTQTVTQTYGYGTTVMFNVDKYLLEGSNTITISLVGQLSKVGTGASVLFQVINLALADNMDISRVYHVTRSWDAALVVPYTVWGTGLKTMEWYIDGERVPLNVQEDEISQSSSEGITRTKYIDIATLTQGRHNLQFRVGIIVGGEAFYSDTLYRDFIVSRESTQGDKVIAVAATIPASEGILDENDTLVLYMTQYEPYSLSVAAWNPDHTYQNTVTILFENEQIASIVCSEGAATDVPIIYDKTGHKTVNLLFNGNACVSCEAEVTETTMDIDEITDALALGFRADGRTNESANKDQWTDGIHTATFAGFKWTETSGWVDGKLIVPSDASLSFDYAPLSGNPSLSGKTIEIEFKSTNVNNDDTVLVDMMDDSGIGIRITATELRLKSEQWDRTITRRFKTDENLRISIVINPRSGSTYAGLVFVYFNGILSIAQSLSNTDSLSSDKQLTIGGHSGATIVLKQLRIYNSALTADEIVNNYILYRDSAAEMIELYDKNNLYDSGSFDLNKIAAYLPVMVITGDLTPIETATDNKATTYMDVEYTNLQNPSYSFRMTHATFRPQGTSSLTYPRKNLRLYTTKSDDTIVYDASGEIVSDRLYSFKPGAQRVDCWTLKADFAESSSTHNTGVARIWNQVMVDTRVDNEYVLRTNAQKIAKSSGYAYDVRTTVDGFPIVIFHRSDYDQPLVFLGKYNFNNDKSTESVFGFKEIPGFDSRNVKCWEFRDSGFDLALFKTPSGRSYQEEFDYYAADYKNRFMQVWESRYPDTETPDVSSLRRLAVWINSTENNLQEWIDNKANYFDLPKLAAYYIYLMRFGAVDQTVKNAMITTEDGIHWYFINYDNDTILGVRNDGLLKFGPDIDRQSPDPELGGYAYAGHNSVLWNNFEADSECMELVRTIDSAMFTAGLTYRNMINMFNVEQSGKWSETIYNKDAVYKYLEPFIYSSKNYLGSLQGSRSDHRKWWISNRFALYDAKWVNDSYNNNAITLLIPTAQASDSFSIVSGKDFYYGLGQNRQVIEAGVYVEQGQSHTFTLGMNFEIGTPLRIYAPYYIEQLDLSNLMTFIGAANFNISAAYNPELGSKMKKLVLGANDLGPNPRRNNALDALSGLSDIVTLEELNIEGYTAITTLDLSTLINLKTLKATASGLASATFAPGAPITRLEFPSSLQALTLNSLTELQTSGIVLASNGENIKTIDIRNCTRISNSPQLLLDWIDNKLTEDKKCSVYMDNVNWQNIDVNDLLAIGRIRSNEGSVTLRGTCHLAVLPSEDEVQELMDIFGESAFQPGAEFYITMPPGIFLTGDTDLLEGETGHYKAVISTDEEIDFINWSCVNPRTGVSLESSEDQATLTTEEVPNIGTSTFNIIVLVYTKNGHDFSKTLPVTVAARVYPTGSQLSIIGDAKVEGTKTYTLICSSQNITGEMSYEWSLTGDILDCAEIVSYTNTSCIVRWTHAPVDGAVSGTLTCTIKKANVSGNPIVVSKTKDLAVIDDSIAVSRAINPYLMDIMYNTYHASDPSTRLASDPNKMYKREAAAVLDEDIVRGSGYTTSIFYSDGNFRNQATSLDELEYFIQLIDMSKYGLYYCSKLRSICIPKNVIKSCGFNSNLKTIKIQGNLTNQTSDFGLNHGVDLIVGDNPTNLNVMQLHMKGTDFLNYTDFGSIVVDSRNTTYTDGTDTDGSNCIVRKSDGALLLGCSNTVIPTNVISIGSYAFCNSQDLENISLPNTLTSVGAYAFSQCDKLSSVTFPEGFTTIGEYSFYNCIMLQSASFSSTIQTFGTRAFDNCQRLGGDFVTPISLTSIGEYAFRGCNFASITLSASQLTTLPQGCFSEDDALTSVNISSSIYSINVPNFNRCPRLQNIIIDGNNTTYSDGREYGGANCIIIKSSNNFIIGCNGSIIPNSVQTIASNAFIGSGVSNIVIPDTVHTINFPLAQDCLNLESISIGSGFTNYSTSYTLSILSNCPSVNTITVDSENQTFSDGNANCLILKANNRLITGCSNSVIPSTVTSIGSQAFQYSSITSITIPSSVTSIGNSAFSNSQLTSITIPSTVTSIDNYAFAYCQNLRSAIVECINPDGGRYMFYNCTNLNSCVLQEGQALMYEGMFYNHAMDTFTIPSSITTLGSTSLYSTVRLTVISLPTTPPIFSSGALYIYFVEAVYVPYGYGTTYAAALGWSQLATKIHELDQNGNIPLE